MTGRTFARTGATSVMIELTADRIDAILTVTAATSARMFATVTTEMLAPIAVTYAGTRMICEVIAATSVMTIETFAPTGATFGVTLDTAANSFNRDSR